MTIRMLLSNCLRIAIIKEMTIIIFVFRNAVQSLLYAILLREGLIRNVLHRKDMVNSNLKQWPSLRWNQHLSWKREMCWQKSL